MFQHVISVDVGNLEPKLKAKSVANFLLLHCVPGVEVALGLGGLEDLGEVDGLRGAADLPQLLEVGVPALPVGALQPRRPADLPRSGQPLDRRGYLGPLGVLVLHPLLERLDAHPDDALGVHADFEPRLENCALLGLDQN